MKSRKSQISIQFHWIFILIAGALILTFFVSIIMKQKSVSEQKIATTLITDLDEIISGAAAGDIESIHIVKIPETEIEYICTKEDYSEYSIKKTGIHREREV